MNTSESDECSICGIGTYFLSGRCDHCNCLKPEPVVEPIWTAHDNTRGWFKNEFYWRLG